MKADKKFDADELNLISLAQEYSDEDKARELLERLRWFMAHRIRFAVSDAPEEKLSGVVEVDETFVGGVGDGRKKFSRLTPVVALIEQGGKMKTRVVASVCQKNLGRVLRECVDTSATLCTDDPAWPSQHQ